MKRLVLALCCAGSVVAQGAAVKHRFLAVDESRAQLHYVDQFDPAKDWTVKLPARYRGLQLDGEKIVVSTKSGYAEYDFKTQRLEKTVSDPEFKGSESVIRLKNGNTLLGCNGKQQGKPAVRVYELDKNDEVIRSVIFPGIGNLRLLRTAKDGALLFGSDKNVVRGNWDGTFNSFPTSEAKRHVYQVTELANGNYCVSTGYGKTLEEWTPKGEKVRTIAEGNNGGEVFYQFFAQAAQVKNGNWAVCNWTGHGAEDSKKGPQMVEFDAEGLVVWKWHDPERAGTIHAVVFLD